MIGKAWKVKPSVSMGDFPLPGADLPMGKGLPVPINPEFMAGYSLPNSSTGTWSWLWEQQLQGPSIHSHVGH